MSRGIFVTVRNQTAIQKNARKSQDTQEEYHGAAFTLNTLQYSTILYNTILYCAVKSIMGLPSHSILYQNRVQKNFPKCQETTHSKERLEERPQTIRNSIYRLPFTPDNSPKECQNVRTGTFRPPWHQMPYLKVSGIACSEHPAERHKASLCGMCEILHL